MRKSDVESDRWRADFAGPPVGGFHDAGAATSHDHGAAVRTTQPGTADDAAQLPGGLVVAALRQQALGNDVPAAESDVVRRESELPIDRRQPPLRRRALVDPRAAEDDDRIGDVMLSQKRLRLEIFELQPQAARFVFLQEAQVFIGRAVAAAAADSPDRLLRSRIVVRRLGMPPGKGLAALGMRRTRRRIGRSVHLARRRVFFAVGDDLDNAFCDPRRVMRAFGKHVMVASQAHGRCLDVGESGRKLEDFGHLCIVEATQNPADIFLRKHVRPACVSGINEPCSDTARAELICVNLG